MNFIMFRIFNIFLILLFLFVIPIISLWFTLPTVLINIKIVIYFFIDVICLLLIITGYSLLNINSRNNKPKKYIY